MNLFDTKDALADAAAQRLAALLREALSERGKASLMLSGGSSPEPVYRKLAKADLAWDGVAIGLIDERWVLASHPKSNATFIRNCFADSPAEQAHFVPLYNGHDTVEAGLDAAHQTLALMAQPFDICVLGMGTDSHTASWFPASQGLAEALDPNNPAVVAAVDAKGCAGAGDATDRITLTYSAIANARHSLLLLPSAEKLDVFRATSGRPPEDAPVQALTQLGDALEIYALGEPT
jgi:6-phosphogluconolactonase